MRDLREIGRDVREATLPSVEAAVATLTGEDEALQQRLYEMIHYAVGRFDWYEDQRHKYLQIGLSLMGFAAAVAVLLAGLDDLPSTSRLLGLASLLILLVTGMVLLSEYWKVTKPDYPHRYLADIKSWYFKYNMPAGTGGLLSSNESVQKDQIETLGDDFEKFVSRWVEQANKPRGFIAEDLEQVLILQVLQGTRSASLKRMRWVLLVGILLFVAVFAGAIGAYFAPIVGSLLPVIAVGFIMGSSEFSV